MKIKWRVSPKPTGRYKSFTQRRWPTGEDDKGRMRVAFDGKEPGGLYVAYEPKKVESVEITVRVARYSQTPYAQRKYGTFVWVTLWKKAMGLTAAKKLALDFLEDHPEYWPVDKE